MTPTGLTAGASVGAVVLSPSLVSTLASVPWWLAVVLVVGGVLCAFVRSVFPQESSHRLEWWRDWWRSRRHSPTPIRRTSRIGADGRPRKTAPARQHGGNAPQKRPAQM